MVLVARKSRVAGGFLCVFVMFVGVEDALARESVLFLRYLGCLGPWLVIWLILFGCWLFVVFDQFSKALFQFLFWVVVFYTAHAAHKLVCY